MPINFNVSELRKGVALVLVEGDIDFPVARGLKEELIGIINRGIANLVLDFGKVRYIDSTGLEALTSSQSKARLEGGDIYLICTNANVIRILEVTGLDDYIRIFKNLDDALAAIDEAGKKLEK